MEAKKLYVVRFFDADSESIRDVIVHCQEYMRYYVWMRGEHDDIVLFGLERRTRPNAFTKRLFPRLDLVLEDHTTPQEAIRRYTEDENYDVYEHDGFELDAEKIRCNDAMRYSLGILTEEDKKERAAKRWAKYQDWLGMKPKSFGRSSTSSGSLFDGDRCKRHKCPNCWSCRLEEDSGI